MNSIKYLPKVRILRPRGGRGLEDQDDDLLRAFRRRGTAAVARCLPIMTLVGLDPAGSTLFWRLCAALGIGAARPGCESALAVRFFRCHGG